MKHPKVILLTSSLELIQHISSSLTNGIKVQRATSVSDMEKYGRENGPSVMLLDIRDPTIQHNWPVISATLSQHLLIGLGNILSDIALEAEAHGFYAVEEIDCDRRRMAALINRALDHLELRLEIEKKNFTEKHLLAPEAPLEKNSRDAFLPLRQFSWAFRHSTNVDVMLERIVEGLATAFGVSRAGIFARNRDSQIYRLKAGICCLERAHKVEYHQDDPLIRWFELQAHLIARSTLAHVGNPDELAMLEQTLQRLGAEIIVPLHAHGHMIGWIFLGHRATGLPFSVKDLEDLSITVDHISSFLENALLYEEVTLQKTMAETLLHSLPTGIIAIDPSGIINWYSTSAQHILNISSSRVLHQPIETLGEKIAAILRHALEETGPILPKTWTDAASKRVLYVQVRRMGRDEKCLGAVAMIQDKTDEMILKERQEQVDRSAFWNELAASMSHEVHNPLVAIKTFAQLLPERYSDPEFRRDFSVLVSQEVDRLNSIIDQLNDFAHPPALTFQPVDLLKSLKKGLETALPPERRGNIKIAATIDNVIPSVIGDEQALTHCFTHVIRNSLEALVHKRDAEIDLSAKRIDHNNGHDGVMITIKDNGHGIPDDIADKIFSPFCTTKARGMGLGLPIVQRTVLDHNGHVHVESNGSGTSVSIVLPSMEDSKVHEAHSHRR